MPTARSGLTTPASTSASAHHEMHPLLEVDRQPVERQCARCSMSASDCSPSCAGSASIQTGGPGAGPDDPLHSVAGQYRARGIGGERAGQGSRSGRWQDRRWCGRCGPADAMGRRAHRARRGRLTVPHRGPGHRVHFPPPPAACQRGSSSGTYPGRAENPRNVAAMRRLIDPPCGVGSADVLSTWPPPGSDAQIGSA